MKTKTLIVFFLLTAMIAHSQERDSSRTVTTVTYSKVGFERTKRDNEIFNLIKINPLAIVLGDIPIAYERRIAEHISVGGSIGMTYADLIYEAIHQGYVYNTDRNFKLGYLFSANINYYPSRHTPALEEFYFGADFRYRHFGSEARPCEGGAWFDEKRNTFDVQFIFGYIHFVSDRVFFDFYGGFGMRKRIAERAECDQNGVIDVSVIRETNDALPTGSGGFRLGFAF